MQKEPSPVHHVKEVKPLNFTGKLIINVYSIFILSVILYQLGKNDKDMPATYRIYLKLVQVTILMLVIDITSRFDGDYGKIYIAVNHVSNFLVFSFNLLTSSLWLLYIYYHIFPDTINDKRLFHGLIALNIANVIGVFVSLPFGWLYYINENNIYQRGPFYFIDILIQVIIVISAFIVIYKNKKKIDKKHYFALQFFSVPPIAGMILQTLSYDIPVTLNSLVLSLFLVFLNIQRQTINTDYLTGVSNRSNFESELANKIEKANKEKTFAGIMIDLFDFKSINDSFGHDVGDHALKASASILLSSIRSNDILARVGGDEFCIILDIRNRDVLDLIIDRIYNSVELYNETSEMPYKLKFSMGYDIYDYRTKMTSDEFRKHIDQLMYKDKEKDREILKANYSV